LPEGARSGVPVRPACLTDRLTPDRSVRQGVAMVRHTGADTKQEILNTATRLFGDFGYRGTSLADIAHEIGYSKASVLYHLPSKEALLAELIAPAAADLRALLARVSVLPLAQARRSTIEGYVDLTVTHKETVAVLQTEEPLLPQDPHFQLYERLVGVLQGEDHNAQARVAAIMVVVGIAAACTERSDLPPEQLRPALVAVALRALGLPADSPPG
jgi:AcrR family transcriptional regulator